MTLATIVKLGGSAITVKSEACTPNLPVIRKAVDQIASYRDPVILLHGGGSFGHPIVTGANLHRGYSHESQLFAISETELFLDELTRIVGVSLLRAKRPFVPLSPMSFVALRREQVAEAFLRPTKHALKLGLIPLIHGDLAFDSARGVGVLSADRLAFLLAIKLGIKRVLFGCDVDGVFSSNPKTSPRAELIKSIDRHNANSVLSKLWGTRRFDATGGMMAKVKESIGLAKRGRECSIFNLTRDGLLLEALENRLSMGTRFMPWKNSP